MPTPSRIPWLPGSRAGLARRGSGHPFEGHPDDHQPGATIPAVRRADHAPQHSIVADAAQRASSRIASIPRRELGASRLVPDVDRVTTRLLALRRELPDVQIHVSTTPLPSPAVIHAVDAFGASFAITSRGEIDDLEREGVAIGRCLHTRPVKRSPTSRARTSAASARSWSTLQTRSRSSRNCRMSRCSCVSRSPHPGQGATLASTSGVAPHDARALVGDCLASGLRVAGFTFHVGGPTARAASWTHAIRRTLTLMRRLEHTHGIRFDTLDLGAGLPVDDRDPAFGLADLARDIRAALADAPSRYRIVIETRRPAAHPPMTRSPGAASVDERMPRVRVTRASRARLRAAPRTGRRRRSGRRASRPRRCGRAP